MLPLALGTCHCPIFLLANQAFPLLLHCVPPTHSQELTILPYLPTYLPTYTQLTLHRNVRIRHGQCQRQQQCQCKEKPEAEGRIGNQSPESNRGFASGAVASPQPTTGPSRRFSLPPKRPFGRGWGFRSSALTN